MNFEITKTEKIREIINSKKTTYILAIIDLILVTILLFQELL